MANCVSEINERFKIDGFVVIPDLFQAAECDDVAQSIGALQSTSAGSRLCLKNRKVRAFADKLHESPELNGLIPNDYLAVQCIFFDKCPSRNWLVPFHRDVHIPLREMIESKMFSDWSVKENTVFARARNDFLDQLVAVRISLDDSLMDNGPLRVIPGSHRWADVPDKINESGLPVIVPKGSGLILNSLLLHASSKMVTDSRRRILHFLFGPRDLPDGAEWV